MIKIYGYNPTTITVAWFLAGAAGTIIWYFHHFVPEFGLFAYLQKHKEIKYSLVKKIFVALIIPIAGTALFIYTFYVGIIADLVEPYFAFVIVDTIIIVGLIIYVIFKALRKQLGGSTVSYMAAEAGRSISDKPEQPK